MRLVVGCPVRSREWIMRQWFLCVEEACENAGIEDHEYLFVVAKGDPTLPVIEQMAERRPVHVLDAGERVEPDQRDWNPPRYRHMALIRNFLLQNVRHLDPDLFLSIDSDILAHDKLLVNLIESLKDFDAVGGKTWMTEGRDACSYVNLVNAHGFMRPEVADVVPVDVIMAIKLMTPKAYQVDYRFDADGEDVGWSRAAAEARVRIGFDGRVTSKHCLYRWMLDEVDQRVGF